MNTKILKIDKDNIDREMILESANVIREGELVAFPTETVYGLGANGLDEDAVKKIYIAKGRPSDNPLILHISSREELQPLVKDIPPIAYKCMERFWPGPLTMIFKKSEIIPSIITGGLDTVAIRMPSHPIASALISASGVPIAAPSANTSGRPSPTNAEHVMEDMKGKIPIIIDGGDTGIGLESTVLDLSVENPMILRPGGITLEDLREIIPNVTQDRSIVQKNVVPKSPGQKYRHYAPKAEMILFTGRVDDMVEEINNRVDKLIFQGKKVGIIATDETKNRYNRGLVVVSGSRKEPETIAANLFSVIRGFDKEDIEIILAEGVAVDNIGMAIMNRMIKAAGGKVINL
ncbi:MAG: L-threonylcarbamoyladenylate synthase [Tissierellaceae bacterium]